MNKVLIAGNHVTSLNIIRILGKMGIPVYLTHHERICIGRFSKYCRRFFLSPIPYEITKYIDFLLELAEKKDLNNAIIIPTNDHIVPLLSKYKEKLSRYFFIPLPQWNILNMAYDKRKTINIAAENGVPVPKSLFPSDINDLRKRISEFKFPIVLKPAFGKDYYFAQGEKMHMAWNLKEAEQYFNQIASVMGEENIIVQEYIPGGIEALYNFSTLMKNGIPYGFFTSKKIRQHPRDFGVGTAAQLVNEPELIKLGVHLFQCCKYEGIGYIEFKKDHRDGKFKLIEINTRLWNFMDLALFNGVNLPYLLYKYALNRHITPINVLNCTIKWVHWWADFGQTVKEVLKGKESFIDYFKSLSGRKKFAVLSTTDPFYSAV
jgi:predicted ATP-grasp superfamily ATP-dependent carboligase